MKHFDAVEILELHYAGDASDETREHLAECDRCTRLLREMSEELSRDSVELQSGVNALPETFWKRQQLSIQRAIDAKKVERKHAAWRYAAAAALTAILSGSLFFQLQREQVKVAATDPVQTATLATNVASESETVPSDPWKSEELSGYHDLVDWESWSDTTNAPKGQS